MVPRGAQQQTRLGFAAIAVNPIRRERRIRMVRAKIPGIQADAAGPFQQLLQSNIQRAHVVLGGQPSRHYGLIAYYYQAESGALEAIEGARHAVQNNEILRAS